MHEAKFMHFVSRSSEYATDDRASRKFAAPVLHLYSGREAYKNSICSEKRHDSGKSHSPLQDPWAELVCSTLGAGSAEDFTFLMLSPWD